MSVLFKKRNRKFRQRESRPDSEDEGIPTEVPDPKPKTIHIISKPFIDNENSRGSGTGSISNKDKEDISVPKVTKLLSFHDEEDDTEVFKLRKSNHSRRLAKQREKERKQRERDAAKEAEFQCDKSEVRKASRKQDRKKDEDDIYAGDEAEDMEMDSDGDKEEEDKTNPFKDLLQSGVIPDAATIYAMKKHRQMAREMGDFIPVEDPEKQDGEKSRLIREDDNDRSDDDDEPSRINFTVNTGAVERQKIRETFLSLQETSANDLENEEAAELELWEREQIKKGVGVTQVSTLDCSQVLEPHVYNSSTNSSFANNHCATAITSLAPPSELLNNKEFTLTTADVEARIRERLSSLQNLNISHKQDYEDIQKEMVSTEELVTKLDKEAPQLSRNYALYQQMCGYVKDLVECFDVKLAHIDLLEGRMVDLYKNRSQKLTDRRKLDVQDQSEEFTSISCELLKGVNAEYLAEKSCSDEMKLRRAAEREGRRMRRRKRRERGSIMVKHQDGMSSDDEEGDLELLEFKKARENILREADTIFEDVVEDFGTLDGVMTNFEKWKYTQISSYREAFVPLCLPKVFGTFIKLALLDWNPLKEARNFEEMTWFHQLIRYGLNYENVVNEAPDDPDVHLVPGIMEKTVISKLTVYIQNVWNPVSQLETTRLVNLIKDLTENYPSINGKSKQFQNCLKAVTSKMEKSLNDDIFMPLFPKELLENRSLGAADYFQRQFWFSFKFFQNILMWEDLIAEQPLQCISLGRLLNRYLIMGLNTSIMLRDTIDKYKAIVSSLPKPWLQSTNSNIIIPLLKPFANSLVRYADSLHVSSSKKSISDEEIREVTKDVVQLLATINALDDAVVLAKKYSVTSLSS